MATSSPLVSVCIPTYRGAAFIGRAIESVLDQTLREFELIIIDDNSPDETAAVVACFDDPRIRFLRNPRNLGPEGNWNRCLDEASGKYFKLLPHDDLIHPTCLQRQVAVLDSDQDERIALVFSARQVLRSDGRALMRRGYPGRREGLIDGGAVMRSCVRRGTNLIGEPGAVLFRKSLADRTGPFDATNPYVVDLDYWFRLLANGAAYYCPENLASFRVSQFSWSVAIGEGQSSDFRRFAKRVVDRGSSPVTTFDVRCGQVTSSFNNLARLLFYRMYLR